MKILGFTIQEWAALFSVGALFGGAMGGVVLWWLKARLADSFCSPGDLDQVRQAVHGARGDVTACETRLGALERQVADLPTHDDVRGLRHDLKNLMQSNAGLAAQVQGHGELLRGIDRRQEIILEKLLEGGR